MGTSKTTKYEDAGSTESLFDWFYAIEKGEGSSSQPTARPQGNVRPSCDGVAGSTTQTAETVCSWVSTHQGRETPLHLALQTAAMYVFSAIVTQVTEPNPDVLVPKPQKIVALCSFCNHDNSDAAPTKHTRAYWDLEGRLLNHNDGLMGTGY